MRDPVIDMMKGVGILFVLIGHTAIPSDYLKNFIYSFHMPLFFIIAGYFAKSYSETKIGDVQSILKDGKRLLLPYVVTTIAILLFTLLRSFVKQDLSITLDKLKGFIYVTYDSVPIWFLVALFWVRVVFRKLMALGRWSLPVSILISGSALLVAHHFIQLPFCILTAMAAIVFYASGWYHKQYEFPKPILAISVICWGVMQFCPRVDLYCLGYGIYPLTILGASGATYLLYKVMQYIYIYIYIYIRNQKEQKLIYYNG